jgi:hypothetical protein
MVCALVTGMVSDVDDHGGLLPQQVIRSTALDGVADFRFGADSPVASRLSISAPVFISLSRVETFDLRVHNL